MRPSHRGGAGLLAGVLLLGACGTSADDARAQALADLRPAAEQVRAAVAAAVSSASGAQQAADAARGVGGVYAARAGDGGTVEVDAFADAQGGSSDPQSHEVFLRTCFRLTGPVGSASDLAMSGVDCPQDVKDGAGAGTQFVALPAP